MNFSFFIIFQKMKIYLFNYSYIKILKIFFIFNMGIGDWGLGIGDWGLGIGPNPQSPIPTPPSPIPHY